MDLRAQLDSPIVLEPLERGIVKTGLFIELLSGWKHKYVPEVASHQKRGDCTQCTWHD